MCSNGGRTRLRFELIRMTYATARRRRSNGELNKLYPEDRAIHEWYRFVLSFPPHLVRDYLQRLGADSQQRVLDPFCGTGTTLVECKKLGIPSFGVEANPMAAFASSVKVDWSVDPEGLLDHAGGVADRVAEHLEHEGLHDRPAPRLRIADGHGTNGGSNGTAYDVYGMSQPVGQQLRTLNSERASLLLTDSISAKPLHKTLCLIDELEAAEDIRFSAHERLALAKALVNSIGNLHFGPEVGVGPLKPDAPVLEPWMATIHGMASDLRGAELRADTEARVFPADARDVASVLPPASVDIVITSPPYPNEKDYTRTTRLESVLLGFVSSKPELQALKKGLVRSNTRGVYKADTDDSWIADHPEIQRIAREIEARRIELGKTSGFERMYARVTKLYFGGMARHLAELRTVLRPGARLAYVVGDQASYLRIMIRTGQILAEIAGTLGYKVTGIDLFRTRLATATKEQLREEVVLLEWPG